MKYIRISYIILGVLISACSTPKETENTKNIEESPASYKYRALNSVDSIKIDGVGDESIWQSSEWNPIDQNWVGESYGSEDFSGRFKLAWDSRFLYVLAEIVDDTLIDIHDDPKVKYWDDDCLEIFIDEDASGGGHQYNHNAFAYHIGLDYSVADIDVNQEPIILNDHITTKRTANGNTHTWEVAMKIFDDTFSYSAANSPVELVKDKVMGFAIAYCDNDFSAERENFIGSEFVVGEDKNRGWIDAGIFGKVQLSK